MSKMSELHAEKIQRMNHIRYILCNDIDEYMDLLDEYVKLDRELNYNTDHKIICESCGEVVK